MVTWDLEVVSYEGCIPISPEDFLTEKKALAEMALLN